LLPVDTVTVTLIFLLYARKNWMLPVAMVTVLSKFQHTVWKISLLPVDTVTVTSKKILNARKNWMFPVDTVTVK
jgi:RecB family endonuclease NucS